MIVFSTRYSPANLLEGLRECVAGGAPMSPEVARRVVKLFREFRPPEKVGYRLTPHELRLLGMLVDGHNYRTATDELGVSVNTVSFHMKNVYEKLQVHRDEATYRCYRNGFKAPFSGK